MAGGALLSLALHWTRSANVKQYKAGTFLAFCRREGEWKLPRDKRKINWNHDIQNIFSSKLMGAFNACEERINTIENETPTDVGSLYKKLEDELEGKRWLCTLIIYH